MKIYVKRGAVITIFLMILMLLMVPASYAYWEAWLKVDSSTYEYRKYNDGTGGRPGSLVSSSSSNIPDWSKDDTKTVKTIVKKTGSLSDDWIVVQHASVLDNMRIVSYPGTGFEGGAVLLFTSGGYGYHHFAARFKYLLGCDIYKSTTGIPVRAIATGTGKIYTSMVCWEYGGNIWEAPQSPTYTLLSASKYFDIVEP